LLSNQSYDVDAADIMLGVDSPPILALDPLVV